MYKQNQFSITFFYKNVRVMFIQYCHNEKLAINWLQKKRYQMGYG